MAIHTYLACKTIGFKLDPKATLSYDHLVIMATFFGTNNIFIQKVLL